jgi:hypothetical protein
MVAASWQGFGYLDLGDEALEGGAARADTIPYRVLNVLVLIYSEKLSVSSPPLNQISNHVVMMRMPPLVN